MQVHRDAVEVVIQAPAKLNLFLEVLAKRADGYHEIETLMCPIDLYDTLYFREEPSGRLELECQSEGWLAGPAVALWTTCRRGPIIWLGGQ
ncbi:MAG: hypothetical protein ABR915_14935 [Thermoguttaceae bacterium]